MAADVFGSIADFFTVTIPNAFKAVVNFIKSNWQGLLLLIVNPFAGAFKLLYDNCGAFRVLYIVPPCPKPGTDCRKYTGHVIVGVGEPIT